MKPIYIRILTIFALIVFISISTTSCDGNQNIQKEEVVEKIVIPGVYVWEGTRKIDYGLEAHERITLTMNADGTCISEEYTVESNDTRTFYLQWYISSSGSIVFGKFNTPNPNGQSEGAQFIGYAQSDGLKMDHSGFYKKIK